MCGHRCLLVTYSSSDPSHQDNFIGAENVVTVARFTVVVPGIGFNAILVSMAGQADPVHGILLDEVDRSIDNVVWYFRYLF
jgi:hypothetical protein